VRAHDILGSAPGIILGVIIARLMPPRIGYWLARVIASAMAKRRTFMFTTARANLSHVVPEATDEELDDLARRAIAHAGRTYYDMFRLSAEDYQRGRVPLSIRVSEWLAVRQALADDRGTVLVGPHMSNFDLAAQWIASQGFEIQGLSLPSPSNGARLVNALRRHHGVVMTPLSIAALRTAVKRLRHGGLVMTGADRPVSLMDELALFFGAPARLPTGHVRLALQTDARIVVACCILEKNGQTAAGDASGACCYRIEFAAPLEMETAPGQESAARVSHANVRHNVQRVLEVAEEMIRQAPDQWLMFVPVWEDEAEKGASDKESSGASETMGTES
jgi:phosphatidylinositol dimannoside acyltransferase